MFLCVPHYPNALMMSGRAGGTHFKKIKPKVNMNNQLSTL